MIRGFLILSSLALATAVSAQGRPSTPTMSCADVGGLVATQGAVVLGTGTYTYDRYVSNRSYCQLDEFTRPSWVPTRDNPQCFAGYRCASGAFDDLD
jgi:hypothetical protein